MRLLAEPLDPPGEAPQQAWLGQLLRCPHCRHAPLAIEQDGFHCENCGMPFVIKGGLLDLLEPGARQLVTEQQSGWRIREQALGRYDLPPLDVPNLAHEPPGRLLVDWLRALLRTRGACRILEIGAGRAWTSRLLAEDGHQVVASDILDDPCIGLGCALRQKHANDRFACVRAQAEALPFRPASFDCVFCVETLRHIADLERVFQEVSRVLRPEGLFIALQEPFRGQTTTQTQRLQDCVSHRIARFWQVGSLPSTTRSDILHFRECLGVTFHEVCRRALFCIACGEEASLRVSVLPAQVAVTLPIALAEDPSATWLRWLDAFAKSFELDAQRLRRAIEQAHSDGNTEIVRELLAYWIGVGNFEGVLIAGKTSATMDISQSEGANAALDVRQIEALLLACATQGIIPIYGMYPLEQGEGGACRWLQPQSGFLVPPANVVKLALACPPRHFRREPVRVEVRIEDEPTPRLIFMMLPGTTVTVRLPLSGAFVERPSLLVRLSANFAFVPSDYNPVQCTDTRLLSLQLIPEQPADTSEARAQTGAPDQLTPRSRTEFRSMVIAPSRPHSLRSGPQP
jgi:Methyltransferase domain